MKKEYVRSRPLTYHIYATVQPVVNFIFSNDRIAPRSDLHPGQRVAMDIIVLQDTTPICKEVHASLKSSVDLIVLERGVAFARDPYSSIRVGKDLVLDKLTSALTDITKIGHERKINMKRALARLNASYPIPPLPITLLTQISPVFHLFVHLFVHYYGVSVYVLHG